MTLRALLLVASALLASALLAACGGPSATPDAGTTDASADAGAPIDAPATDDATAPIDAPADAAPAIDAPTGADAGSSFEALRDGWCRPLATVVCRDRFACGCAGDRPPPDLESCVGVETMQCMMDLEDGLGMLFAAGRLRADPEELAACAARIEASFAACSARPGDLEQWCIDALVDATPLGGGCAVSSASCEGGASCVSGACEALPVAGEPCEFDVCAEGAACRDGTCAAISADGGPCTRDRDCADALLCVAGTCRAAFVALGAACDEDAECVAGARCTGGTCERATVTSCADDGDCPSLAMCIPEYGRVCQAAAPIGGACTGSASCEPTAYCDFTTGPGTCAARGGAGEICVAGDEACAEGTICDGSVAPPRCRGVGGPGEACSATGIPRRDQCAPDLSCVGGFCAPWPNLDQPCSDDGECAPGLRCRADAGGVEACRNPAGSGETCRVFADECGDGLFCDGRTVPEVCAPRRASGEACDGFLHECAEGLTCIFPDGRGGSGTCLPLPEAGQRCNDTCSGALVCADGIVGASCVPRVCDAIPARDVVVE